MSKKRHTYSWPTRSGPQSRKGTNPFNRYRHLPVTFALLEVFFDNEMSSLNLVPRCSSPLVTWWRFCAAFFSAYHFARKIFSLCWYFFRLIYSPSLSLFNLNAALKAGHWWRLPLFLWIRSMIGRKSSLERFLSLWPFFSRLKRAREVTVSLMRKTVATQSLHHQSLSHLCRSNFRLMNKSRM
jgi:hypothetical protein